MPRARATTRWRGRASIPTSSYRGRPDGWASWKASPRSKRSSATTRRSRKTRPRSTRCARTTSISPPTATGVASRLPILPPARALLVGLMPLQSAGVNDFRAKHPTYDGRGVVIGILDTGVDPGVDGLIVTSTGAPKLLDVRDFSGEGVVRLTPVT